MSTKWHIVILLGLGLLTRFLFFGYPNETVFDEVHFGKFVSGYYTREYFFDIHPPLGKLVIAEFAKSFDFKPEFAFAEIGDEFPDKQYTILRFLPSLAGALLPLVIYLLMVQMGISRLYALLGGLLIVFENALLTQSHYILLDSFLLLFGFMALLFYFKYRNSQSPASYYWLLATGLFGGLAMSIKWTGVGFLALPLAMELWRIYKDRDFKNVFKLFVLPGIIAFIVYFSFFAIHLMILNKTGTGDAFMSKGFQKTLAGSQYANDSADTPNLFQKFSQLNLEMYKANQRLDAEHPYSSPWYTWPFMLRTIFYWVQDNARIYLIGNPIIWWGSTIAVIISFIYYLSDIIAKRKNQILSFLLLGYIINMLPFVGVKRVMFLYHYFTAYIFATIMLVWLISQHKNSKQLFGILLTASVVAFIYFAPLSYGLDLSPKAYEARVWFESWR